MLMLAYGIISLSVWKERRLTPKIDNEIIRKDYFSLY
jgi:hypothetical protein